MEMPFGKHKGVEIDQVPRSYCQWIVDQVAAGDFTFKNDDLAEAVTARAGATKSGKENLQKTVEDWYTRMLEKHGATGATSAVLKDAYEELVKDLHLTAPRASTLPEVPLDEIPF